MDEELKNALDATIRAEQEYEAAKTRLNESIANFVNVAASKAKNE